MSGNVCIYHGVDLDGYCSAAIYNATTEGKKMFLPLNYGWDVPWDELHGADVTMIDFSFQPLDKFLKLADVANSVLWIDHHSSAIKETNNGKLLPGNVTSILDDSRAACEIAWSVLASGPAPRGVFLLGDYDCWRHSDPETMPYQMGMRFNDMESPMDDRWKLVFGEYQAFHEATLVTGRTILEWDDKQNAKSVRGAWFPVEFAGFKWMGVNRGFINSRFWDEVWDDMYDGMLSFCWLPKGYWTVSLYSKTVDCGAIANMRGGGGHKGAAGFQVAQTDIISYLTEH